MPNTTSRIGIVTPLGTEAVNIDAHLKQIADQVDALAAIFGQGTLASRPTSTPGTPGKTGRLYYATDNGKIYYDYGTGWVLLNADIPTLGPDSITSTEIAANAVGNSEMADNAVGAAEIIDGSVGAAEISNALKPSAGAGAATEALRAIGSGAGNVVAGNDARLTNTRVPGSIPIGTSLPGSPTNGDIAILTDSLTAPTYSWMFQYVSGIADSYKWVFIGGSPRLTSASGSDPQLAAPRAGLYNVEYGGFWSNGGTTSAGSMTVTLQVNGVGVSSVTVDASNTNWGGGSRQRVGAQTQIGITVGTAGHVIKTTGPDAYSTLEVAPIRVA